MQKTDEKTLVEMYEEVLEYVCSHKTRRREFELRKELSEKLKAVKYQYGDYGDTKRLQKYIATTGVIISDSNFNRMFSTVQKEIELVTEKTYFIALQHAVKFFGVPDDHAMDILESLAQLKS